MLELTCSICGKKLDISCDTHFVLSDISTRNNMEAVVLCEKCAETTTVMDMYLSGKITMANSLDDVLETNGVIISDVLDEKERAEMSDDHKPWGYIENCPLSPCENCGLYYGEIDSCMAGEENFPTPDEIMGFSAEELEKFRYDTPHEIPEAISAKPEEVEKFFTSDEPVFTS